MYVKQNDSGADTDGVIKYGNVSSDTSQYGSGIRFSKSSVYSVVYATNKDGDIGTGDFTAINYMVHLRQKKLMLMY